VTVEPVKEGDRFSIGEMENVSKKGVKWAEEATISAKENDVDIARQRCKGRAEISRTGSCKRPPPRLQPLPAGIRGCERWCGMRLQGGRPLLWWRGALGAFATGALGSVNGL